MSETPVELSPWRKDIHQSDISDMDTCTFRIGHGFHWNPTMRKNSQEAAMGTAFHAIQQARAVELLGAGTPELDEERIYEVAMGAFITEMEESTEPFGWRDDDTGNIDAAIGIVLEMDIGYWAQDGGPIWTRDGMRVILVEETFDVQFLPGWTARGTLDLVFMDANGWLYVLDYKTSRNKKRPGWERTRNTPQMAMYRHFLPIWWQHLYPGDNRGQPRPMRFMYDVMSWGTEITYRHYEAHPTEVDTQYVLRQAQRATQLVDQGPDGLYIPQTDSHLCDPRWCDYYRVCEAGERLQNQMVSPGGTQ